jgi:hypothetical protein
MNDAAMTISTRAAIEITITIALQPEEVRDWPAERLTVFLEAVNRLHTVARLDMGQVERTLTECRLERARIDEWIRRVEALRHTPAEAPQP